MVNSAKQILRLVTDKFHRRPKGRNEDSKETIQSRVLGGVYHVTDEAADFKASGLKHCESSSTLSTLDSMSAAEDDSDLGRSWTSSCSPTHHQGAPLLVRSAISQRHLVDQVLLSDHELLGRVMLRATKLPKPNTGHFVSNHIMINHERTRRRRAPLKRNSSLDQSAQRHAHEMAKQGRLFHPDLGELPDMGNRLGANVGLGSNVNQIHSAMKASEADKNNMIDRRFVSMGVGTAKGADGTLYLCQVFGN